MESRSGPRHSPTRSITLVLILMTGCSQAGSPAESVIVSSPSTSAFASASSFDGRTQALDPGGLDVGTRYVVESLGVSVQPDVDGWFAVMPQGGDIALSRGDVTVYFLVPVTIISPDGSSVLPAPAEPQAFVDAIGATSLIEVGSVRPWDADGLNGLDVELVSSGGGPDSPLLTTGSGEYGLVDGEAQWVVIEVGGKSMVVSIERPDAPDIDAAWEIAGPLVESMETAS